jgi:U2 small nuclear ribonucleoprotein A'
MRQDHDAIDFTDNDIASLSNFPLSPRITTLLLARNRVSQIQGTIAQSIPNLTTLVLTANNISELADLDPLRLCSRLTHITLLENLVVRKEVRGASIDSRRTLTGIQNYRYWLIWRIPSLRFIDFERVKEKERERAKEMFGTAEEPTALASKIMGTKSRTFDLPTGGAVNGSRSGDKALRVQLTAEERKRVEKMIREAKSLQEINRLEKELNEGRIPGGVLGSDRMDMS